MHNYFYRSPYIRRKSGDVKDERSREDLELLDFLVECFAIDSKDLGCLGLIAPAFRQHGDDMIFLHLFEGLGLSGR
jgi:hypothetical protein